MSQKNNVHRIDSPSSQATDTMNYRHLFLFALVVGVLITLFGLIASCAPPAMSRPSTAKTSFITAVRWRWRMPNPG